MVYGRPQLSVQPLDRTAKRMQFSHDLEASAHRSAREYAWRRAEALRAVLELAGSGRAILGGELWLVLGSEIHGSLPQRSGPPAAYHWESKREASESWRDFVSRSCAESLEAINDLPAEGEIQLPAGAEIYYNLTWASDNA